MKKYLKYVGLGMAGLALISLIMVFVSAIGGDSKMTGLEAIFGYSEEFTTIMGGEGKLELTKFSFMNLLTYLLVIGVGACGVLSFLKGDEKLLYVAIGLAVLAAIFFLLTKSFIVLTQDMKDLFELAGKTFAEEAELGAGPIIGAICMFLAAAAGGAKVVIEKFVK